MTRIFCACICGLILVGSIIGCVGLGIRNILTDAENPLSNCEDLSQQHPYSDYIGKSDEIKRECYLYASKGTYQLLGYMTDDRNLLATIAMGTKVKIVRVIRISDQRSAHIGSNNIIHTSTITPILAIEGMTKIVPKSDTIVADFLLLNKFYARDKFESRVEFK